MQRYLSYSGRRTHFLPYLVMVAVKFTHEYAHLSQGGYVLVDPFYLLHESVRIVGVI